MTSNITDLNELLGTFSDELSQPERILSEIGSQITMELKQRVTPFSKTGRLKNSISYTVSGDTMSINMVNYGVFQNYGVMGITSSRIPVNVPEFGITVDGYNTTGRFRFGTRNYGEGPGWGVYYSGIRAKSFFNMADITNQIAVDFAAQIV